MKRNSKLLTAGLILAFAAATQGGCTGPTKAADNAAHPHGMPTTEATAPQLAPLEGKVVETMDAGGYTYICLEKGGKKTWAAIPTMKVTVGDEIKLQPGAVMPNFSSKTLNRTFESIVFSSGPLDETKTQPSTVPPGHPEATNAAKSAPTAKHEPPVLAGKVVETMDAGNYTYICLEKDGKKGWAAVPTTKVSVGDQIELEPGVEMGKFTSKKLKRTFDDIYFTSGFVKK